MTKPAGAHPHTPMAAPARSLERALAEELIHFATLAPSGHNTQPWTFFAFGNAIDVFADLTRRLPVVDPDDHALYISVGCAIENLVIAAAARGFQSTVTHLPDRIRIELSPTESSGGDAPLFRAISERQTNRSVYNGRPIPDAQVRALIDASAGAGVDVKVFRPGTTDAGVIISFVEEGNIAQFADSAFVSELVSWIRFTRREAEATRDGLISRALGFPWIPRWLGRLIMTRLVTPRSEAARQAKAIRSSAQLLLFIAQSHDRRHWVELGRSFERVALTATSLGIAHAHVNMPCEVEPIRRRLAEQLELPEGAQPLLLIRIGYGKAKARAPRRPVKEVMRAM